MPLFKPRERLFATSLSQLAYCNPFLPERVEWERAALGDEFVDTNAVWSVRAEGEAPYPNLDKLAVRAETLASQVRERLQRRIQATAQEVTTYRDVVIYVLYQRYEREFYSAIVGGPNLRKVSCYRRFRADFEHFLRAPHLSPTIDLDPDHLFACLFQIRRAFHEIYNHIVGASMPTARLRAAVWQSIFTHDMRRYRRSLYARMRDVTTLVTGPSGTGKELVARAIALSQYVPFDAARLTFATDIETSFHALNLSALPVTLIESELFGHRKGSFTGALDDRTGWLEACPPHGTVLLDEIGELDPAIQVKLLRVLHSREFQRIGDTTSREFQGKLIAATNQDLPRAIQAGRFREDLYYRLCSDLIVTPSLSEQLADSPAELGNLVRFVGERIAGPKEAVALGTEVLEWIEQHLGTGYAWPGNVRELEQCVRNVLIRNEYRPQNSPHDDPRGQLAEAVTRGRLTAHDLLRRYCTMIYADTGTYQEAARRLGLDRRTVKAYVDSALLSQLSSQYSGPRTKIN